MWRRNVVCMEVRKNLKVLSYNIHKGFALGNRTFTLPAIRDALTTLLPDVVFLQEVLGRHDGHARRVREWPGIPQHQYIAGDMWPHIAYGKTAQYDQGHHGNAILSRYPILHYESIDISTNPLETRGLLHAVLDVPGVRAPVHCVCVHLNLLKGGREKQLRQICARISSSVGSSEPVILAGDFNDWQRSASGVLTRELGIKEVFFHLHGQYAPTFPVAYPILQLDRVYARGLVTLDGQILVGSPWQDLSDHAPLYAELLEVD
jgi:endonuclease/exonuclease/phosphatase family metal-dependent hydrolase